MYSYTNEDDESIGINLNNNDLCCNCGFVDDCPLINALSEKAVCLVPVELEISNCGLYCPNVNEQTIKIESFVDRLRIALRILRTGVY